MAPGAPDLLAVDTDVLIDYLRDRPEAVAFLENCQRPSTAGLLPRPASGVSATGAAMARAWRTP